MSTDKSNPLPRGVKDISGQPFGKLTAVRYAGSNLGSQAGAYWICICECGTEKTVSGRALRGESIRSCGCSKHRTNEVGNKYNKLTVIEFAGKTNGGDSQWLCQCECGNTTTVARGELRKQSTKSCGCHRASAGGRYKTPEYNSWKDMKNRCYNPKAKYYHCYGARGIVICKGWLDSFVSFMSDMGNKPSSDHSVERKNNDGNYSCGHCDECIKNGWPANCKWASTMEQGQNTRKTRRLTYNGETCGLREWARRLGITHYTLARRLDKQGWTFEQAVIHYTTSSP